MKKQFQLAALDLDGTLFNPESIITDKNKDAIRRASAAGVTFVISTGRPYRGLPLEDMAQLGIRYAITANGAAVYQVPEKKCLSESCMPYDRTADLIDELLTLQVHMDLFIRGDAYTPDVCKTIIEKNNALPPSLKEYILSTRSLIPDITGLLRREQTDIQKVTMNFLKNEAGGYIDRDHSIEILNRYPDFGYLSGGFGNLEFTRKDVTKAKGLSFLCEYLQISPEHTIACGDSENDLEMLKAAGMGIAMANAPEHVRSVADELTLSNEEDGVAAMIEKWLL